jgi:hypothetical protein
MENVDRNIGDSGNTFSRMWSQKSWEVTIEWQTREARLSFRVCHIPLCTESKTKAD